MKKIILAVFALASFAANAQSFYKGALVADLNWGVEVYNVAYHYALKSNTNIDTTTHSGAASKSFGLGVEYGVTNWLGLGLCGKIDNYVTSKDAVTGTQPTAGGGQFGAIINFHVLRKQHFNLVLGINAGYSHLTYKTNDYFGTEVYGDGVWSRFSVIPRYYFGRFGIEASLNFPRINYPNMTTSSKTLNSYIVSSWKASGVGFGFGVQYRFLNSK
jgi:hypothetical protein